ncbi:MAG: hypothetical protein HKN13_09730 [Rhodothermales bacterium]|nr:hypothetical protein [Rhodothermales bacterium]
MSSKTQVLLIGLDIGGTKTKIAYRISDAAEIRTLVTHGANLKATGSVHVAGLIATIVSRIRAQHTFDDRARIVAGVAGAGRQNDQNEVEALFLQAHTNSKDRLTVYSDAAIALEGAFNGGPGMILIAGTGSGVYARSKAGETLRAGGWGSVLGDPASGYRIGLRALRAVARDLDGGPATALTTYLEKHRGLKGRDQLVTEVYSGSVDVAQISRLVLNLVAEGDQVLNELLDQEIVELTAEVGYLIKDRSEIRLVLMGGLCDHPLFKRRLRTALTTSIPQISFVEPAFPPEVGALRLCE